MAESETEGRPGRCEITTLITLRELGRRAKNLHDENLRLNKLLRPLIRRTSPGLLEVYGVGYDTAAKLLVAAGDNRERLRSEAAWAHMCGVAPIEASSGKTNGEICRILRRHIAREIYLALAFTSTQSLMVGC